MCHTFQLRLVADACETDSDTTASRAAQHGTAHVNASHDCRPQCGTVRSRRARSCHRAARRSTTEHMSQSGAVRHHFTEHVSANYVRVCSNGLAVHPRNSHTPLIKSHRPAESLSNDQNGVFSERAPYFSIMAKLGMGLPSELLRHRIELCPS